LIAAIVSLAMLTMLAFGDFKTANNPHAAHIPHPIAVPAAVGHPGRIKGGPGIFEPAPERACLIGII
jgi:hypothetical protein